MFYTATEITLFMALAAGFGFLAGWFLQRARRVGSAAREPLHRLSAPPDARPMSPPEPVDLRVIEAEDGARMEAARAAVMQRMQQGALPRSNDDLTKVRGIGPVISNRLYEMGIASFEQIARFTEEDIELVGAALGSFGGRIRRDDWIESARRLQQTKQASKA